MKLDSGGRTDGRERMVSVHAPAIKKSKRSRLLTVASIGEEDGVAAAPNEIQVGNVQIPHFVGVTYKTFGHDT